jgi:hypothetical protein
MLRCGAQEGVSPAPYEEWTVHLHEEINRKPGAHRELQLTEGTLGAKALNYSKLTINCTMGATIKHNGAKTQGKGSTQLA